jgi:cytochrome b involved in lipid metabolism
MKKSFFVLATVVLMTITGCGESPATNQPVTPVVTTPTTDNTTPTPTTSIDSVQPTSSPKPITTPTPNPAPTGPKQFTMAEVVAANTPSNCLTVINGNVYNLTDWIDKHPGGDQNILRICGIDGSSAYSNQHGGQRRPESILQGYKVGVLK